MRACMDPQDRGPTGPVPLVPAQVEKVDSKSTGRHSVTRSGRSTPEWSTQGGIMHSAPSVKTLPILPLRCRREDIDALPLLYREAAKPLIERGEIVILEGSE